jgi:hypothetical protein
MKEVIALIVAMFFIPLAIGLAIKVLTYIF